MDHLSGICYIVGAMSLTPNLRPYPAPGDYVIAADRGFDSLLAYGVMPDLAVGDFDSLGHRPNHPNVIQLPAEKDDTDMVYIASEECAIRVIEPRVDRVWSPKGGEPVIVRLNPDAKV